MNIGAVALVGSDVYPRSSGQGGMSGLGHFHGTAASHLAAMTQVSGITPHHTADRELQCNTPC